MGLKLNKISEDILRQNLEEELAWIEKKLAESPPPADDAARMEKYYYYLGTTSSDVGMMLYQQEHTPAEIRPHLKRGGEALLTAHTARPMPRPDEYRSPWLFEKTLNLIICFGSAEERRLASTVAAWKYRNPPHKEHDAFVAYLEALKKYGAGVALDEEDFARVIEHCRSERASKRDRLFLRPEAEGFRAAARRHQEGFERAVTELVKAHETEARSGELRRSRDGLMSLPALMLAKLGQEQGLTCNVASPYLPLQLLG